ncbi:competence CoiA-like predicted nuclease [Lysobacter niastensis]|uniref:Competence CoiA-like predicted nuclease n=1 Tax=Lysobacter niastensis TaxID=380629 RepID=A0ABU1WCJ5_9GAMM|nr:competence protein CoiA family protein [Lysobacter niastensis]MDR7135318.1 competence CoiA-like predicted nuclease [Lysobacter niastensis]
MLFALADGVKRQPLCAGERAICPHCDSEVVAVLPSLSVWHWRHKANDCDPWSEPEGEWHFGWKERFEPAWREVSLIDHATNEKHRADIFCEQSGSPTVVELQHSPIVEEERLARERFYARGRRMFWLLHLHDERSLRGTHFALSLNYGLPVDHHGRTFYLMRWGGSSTRFIERWKQSKVHVFFDFRGQLFYLATAHPKLSFPWPWAKGWFAVCPLSTEQFISAVSGH